MANTGMELLAFTDSGKIYDLKFSSVTELTTEERAEFLSDCQNVIECRHAVDQDLHILAFHLRELKERGAWKDIIDPDTKTLFSYSSFSDFCDSAFGFHPTFTSEMVRIAQFIKLSGDNVDFIDAKYANYNKTQLVELASVAPADREYFNPNMTVDDFRLAKKYIKSKSFSMDKHMPGFDIQQGAKAWAEEKEREKADKEFDKSLKFLGGIINKKSEQLPGQISLDNMTEVFEETRDEKRAPVLAEVGGGDFIEDVQPVMPEPVNVEEDNPQYRMKFDVRRGYEVPVVIDNQRTETVVPDVPMPPIDVLSETEDEPSAMDVYAPIEQEEEQESIAEALTSRGKVRDFLNSYEEWFDVSTYFFKSYVHYWKNGAAVFAVESIARANMESEPTTVVRYYWRRNEEERAFEISKDEIWKYIVEHKDEL